MNSSKQALESGLRRSLDLEILNGHLVDLREVSSARAFIECGFYAHEDTLVLLGWLFDPESNVDSFVELCPTDSDTDNTAYSHRSLTPGVDGVRWSRSERRDVTAAMKWPEELNAHRHGFAMIIPHFDKNARLGVQLNDGSVALVPFKLQKN